MVDLKITLISIVVGVAFAVGVALLSQLLFGPVRLTWYWFALGALAALVGSIVRRMTKAKRPEGYPA